MGGARRSVGAASGAALKNAGDGVGRSKPGAACFVFGGFRLRTSCLHGERAARVSVRFGVHLRSLLRARGACSVLRCSGGVVKKGERCMLRACEVASCEPHRVPLTRVAGRVTAGRPGTSCGARLRARDHTFRKLQRQPHRGALCTVFLAQSTASQMLATISAPACGRFPALPCGASGRCWNSASGLQLARSCTLRCARVED